MLCSNCLTTACSGRRCAPPLMLSVRRMKEKHMKQFVKLTCLGTLLAAGLVACDNGGRQQPRSTSSAREPRSEARSSPAKAEKFNVLSVAPIPADVTYTIINTDVIPGIKRSLDVRLNRKVQEDVLRSIARELKKADRNRYERTFIVYYLPEMKVGAGGWATTHFNPDLEVNILGLTAKQEEALFNAPEDAKREVIGSWLDQSPMVGGKITIYRKDGKLYLEQKFKDGSSSNKEMVEKPSSRGRRFEEKGGASFGEHYVIDRQSNLQIRDQEGLVATAKEIK